MNVFLLNKERDFDLQQELRWNAEALTQDLELNTLFEAMAHGNEFLFEVAEKVILGGENIGQEAILYRQEILNDCLKNPAVVREIFEIATEALEKEKKNFWGIFRNYPHSVLYRSIEVFEMFIGMLKKLKKITDVQSVRFNSPGFVRFFDMINEELSENYFQEMEQHLAALRFRDGVLMSARLGKGNKGGNYILRKTKPVKRNWWQRIIRFLFPDSAENGKGGIKKDTNGMVSAYTFFISSRDEGGVRSLGELKDEGINLVANSLAQSDEHVLHFFNNLRTELAFYIGCLDLHETLTELNEPVCFPEAVEDTRLVRRFTDLYDVCLALNTRRKVVGNDCMADEKKLIMITGANQGGKSTFLRSLGLAQLMMQCGMFAPAVSFRASICNSLITHFRREEDSGMKSGKLDEEMARMDQIADRIRPGALILFNESFAATNEREGSEIARQIVSALLEHNINVIFVTHLYEFAQMFYGQKQDQALFLRAERQINGVRTYKLSEGAPLQTSYGTDLYREVFTG